MADLYANYAALAAAHPIGVDYQILTRAPARSKLAHIAIHGGGIEPGTTELADYLAASAHGYYTFDAMMASGNSDLHITSTNFDEPQALALVATSDYVISWHGASGTDPVTYIGGLDSDTASRIQQALQDAGFTVSTGSAELNGNDPLNITNKGSRSMGVQMELTLALRESFFTDFTRTGRQSGPRTADWYTYTAAIRTALNGLDSLGKPQGIIAAGQSAQPVRSSASGVGDFGIPTLSPLSVDGMPLDAVNDALRLSQATRQVGAPTEPFWSSSPQPNGSPIREVFEFSLTGERQVNQVNVSLAHLPQRAWFQYRDRAGVWHPFMIARTQSPAQVTILDSVPAVLPAGVTGDLRLHPQHFGSGHWLDQQIDVEPVTASRFRIIMVRLPSLSAPRGINGLPVDYSLGVKNAAVSYRAASRSDLPWLPQADPEHTVPLSASQDVLGSPVEFSVRTNDASNLLRVSGGVWRCAPQPIPQAVVNVYLDTRTASGDPQVIDRLYLEPLTAGPTMNLYYSGGNAQSPRFVPANTALSFPSVRPSVSAPVGDPEGLLFDTGQYLDVDNSAIQFDPRAPFLLAMTIQPQYTSDDAAVYTVLDDGVLNVSVTAGSVQVMLGERTVTMAPVSLGYNQRLSLAVAFDGDRLTVRTPWETRAQDQAAPPAGVTPSVLRMGGSLTGAPGQFRLRSLLLAMGRAEDIDTIDPYWDDPAAYALPPGYGADASQHTSANAILRMDPSLVTAGVDSVCPWGLIGGPGECYPDMVWTPIPSSFTLRKGYVRFRPVLARHLKLEFTNLAPMAVTPSAAAPLARVQLFPEGVTQGAPAVATPATSTSGATASATTVALQSGPYQYQDATRIQASPAAAAPFLPTEALFAPDPLDAQTLRRNSAAFPYLPLPAVDAPRFTATGVHRYHVVDVAMDTKTAYTVALRQVLAYAVDPTAERDTEQYIELFQSTEHLSGYFPGDPEGWSHSNGTMVSDGLVRATGVRLTSETYISRRRVTGLQMATQMSPPKQLVADPDFDDPFLHQWRQVGDATIDSSDLYATTIGQMALVERGHAQSTWDAIEAQYPTWGDIEASVDGPYLPLWEQVEQSNTSTSDSGGIESLHGVTPPPAGRLYAAARVFTTGALTSPLLLQLVNGDGRIIAEVSQDIPTAQVAEFFVDATVHALSADPDPTWDDVSNSGTRSWSDMEALGSWGDVTGDYALDDIYDVRVRLVQEETNGTDQWLIDSLAIYSDPVIWEVTRDGGINWFELIGVRNDPRGAFRFPDLPPGDRTNGTQLRWRVTAYAPDVSLAAVVVRPWYASLNGAVPFHDSLGASGAATSLADYYPDVTQDPYWQAWSKPIPQDWWLAARQWQMQQNPVTPPLPVITVTDALVEGTSEGAPASFAPHVLTDSLIHTS